MFKKNFEITDKDTIDTFKESLDQLTANLFFSLSKGMWRLEISKPTRTLRQNRCIHALFGDLATELNSLGIELSFGKFKASFTEITAKEFFKQIYLGGKKTSKCTTKELADAVKKVIIDLNGLGGQLAIKDKGLTELLKNN